MKNFRSVRKPVPGRPFSLWGSMAGERKRPGLAAKREVRESSVVCHSSFTIGTPVTAYLYLVSASGPAAARGMAKSLQKCRYFQRMTPISVECLQSCRNFRLLGWLNPIPSQKPALLQANPRIPSIEANETALLQEYRPSSTSPAIRRGSKPVPNAKRNSLQNRRSSGFGGFFCCLNLSGWHAGISSADAEQFKHRTAVSLPEKIRS